MRVLAVVIIFVSSVVLFGGCSPKKDFTIEETVIMETFVKYSTVAAYDRICMKSEMMNANMSDPRKVNYIGNMQFLSARAGGLIQLRNPNLSIMDNAKRLLVLKKDTEKKMEDTLKEDGCDSQKAKYAARLFELFTTAHPAQVYSLVNKEIIKRGGTVTPLEEFDKLEVIED